MPSRGAQPRGVRAVAWRVLGRLSYRPHDVRSLVDRELREASLARADRGLLTELVTGVVKRRLTLDTILRAYISRAWATVEPRVGDLLRLAAYQMVFLERVPRHAVVNETVELSRQVDLGHAARFLNGVLRSLSAEVGPSLVDGPRPGAVPVHSGRWRPMARDVFAGFSPDAVEYLSRAWSLPEWLVGRWRRAMSAEEVRRIGDYFNAPPVLWLRVNSLRATRRQVAEALRSAGAVTAEAPHPLGLRVEWHGAPSGWPGFADGWWTVQDLTAMRVSDLVGARPGWRVLDVCAAPGGKTTDLAARVGAGGRVTACDRQADRLARVEENCRRLGLENVACRPVESDDGSDLPAGPFDAVLVDAPCSNTGVLGRRPEARWRLQAEHIERLSRLQGRLLAGAADRVRPGGVLVYATCSIEPEENAAVAAGLLQGRTDLRREAEEAFVPGEPADGGWAVRLRRMGG